jgi:N-ethylmaleimide reductase
MKGKRISKIFEPIELNNITLNNRIAMAPMTRSRAIGNLPNTMVETYYSQRASAGLIITEGVAPSANGLGYARIPGIYTDEQTAAWANVAQTVRARGGAMFMQLMHTGRIAHVANMPEGAIILAPSAIAATGDMWTDTQGMQPMPLPAEMSIDDIKATIAEFVSASENAIRAGFDGVELHGANGYLLEQFINPSTNTRTDEYGGSVANRIRFVVELVETVTAKIGSDKVAIRLSPYNTYNDMPAYDETAATYNALSSALGSYGLAYLHIIDYAARSTAEGLELLQTIRANFNGVLMLNGGYTIDRAEEVLHSGLADMVSFGAPFIANPDLPHRLLNNIPLAQPNQSLFFTPEAEGYIDYAPADSLLA